MDRNGVQTKYEYRAVLRIWEVQFTIVTGCYGNQLYNKSIADFFMISAKKSYCKVYTIQTQFVIRTFFNMSY